MANPEHIAILRSGAPIWNQWRFTAMDVKPDLSGADLRNCRAFPLRGAFLANVDLSGARLEECDFGIHADLRGSDLSHAQLKDAYLFEADLAMADLSDCDLRGADMGGAYLGDAILTKARLARASLPRADLLGAKLLGADLRSAAFTRATLRAADLSGADLTEADFTEATLENCTFRKASMARGLFVKADLRGARELPRELSGIRCREANLMELDFEGAQLKGADLSMANLALTACRRADLSDADLPMANLFETDLRAATLRRANLICAMLVRAKLDGADLEDAHVYGMSAWDLSKKGLKEDNLVLTAPNDSATLKADSLEMAQFLYFLRTNANVRQFVDTVSRKVVLILGRFTPRKRRAILDMLRLKLKRLGYVPIVFDFEKPTERDFTETIRILAGVSRFVIADITNPRSAPLELQATVPNYMVPFAPICQEGEQPFGMFRDLWLKYGTWMLEPLSYVGERDLADSLEVDLLGPVEELHEKLTALKAKEPPTRRTTRRSGKRG